MLVSCRIIDNVLAKHTQYQLVGSYLFDMMLNNLNRESYYDVLIMKSCDVYIFETFNNLFCTLAEVLTVLFIK